MEMSKESAENIVLQLQQAHRISVAFYRRILPTLDEIANQFGCSFLCWDPLHTGRPGRSKSQPSQSWAWDYVPLFASSHTYRSTKNEKRTSPEDFGITFDLYIDDSFSYELCDQGQPDPIGLPIGKAVLKAYLYKPKKLFNKSFDDLWFVDDESDPEIGKWRSVSENWAAIGFEWPLVEVIINSQVVTQALLKHIKFADR